MKLLNLFICNYGSFWGRHRILLADRGLVAVVGENLDDARASSNGAGKSTWCDALDWCLFGVVPRSDEAHTVMNEQVGKDCCVTVTVSADNGDLVQVTRLREWKGLSGPRLTVNGKEITALDARETQKLIEKTLGLDREVFHAAVLSAQGDQFEFAEATDAERKALLTRIIPELGEVDALGLKTVKELEETNKALAVVNTDLAVAREQVRMLMANDPRPKIAQWEVARAADVDGMQRQRQPLWDRKKELEQSLAKAHLLPMIPKQPERVWTPGEQAATEAVERAEAEFRKWDKQFARVSNDAWTAGERCKKLQGATTGICSACGNTITAEHLAKELATAQTSLAEATAAVQETQAKATHALSILSAAKLDAGRATQEAMLAWQKEYDAFNAVNTSVKNAMALAQRDEAELKRVLDSLVDLDKRLAAAQSASNPWSVEAEKWAASVSTANGMVALREAEGFKLAKRVRALEFWKVGFGAKGLKSYLLDSKIGDMTQETNRWVSLLTGGTVSVGFRTQREVGKGKNRKLVEELDIVITKANPDGTLTERNYRSWSGGEKYRIALGIDFGLSRLVAKRAERSYDVLILDEVFQHLDNAGKEAVAELLHHLSQEKSSIFVIDHDHAFQAMFPGRMVVRKQHRRSRVLGGEFYAYESLATEEDGTGNNLLSGHPAFPE